MNALTEITLCSMCSQSPLVEVFKKKCGAIYIAQSMIALFEMGKIVVFVRDKGGGISRFWSASLTLTHGRGGLFSWAWYTSRPAISDSCATRLTNISPWGRSQGFALFEPAAGQAQPLRPELARRKCDTRPAGSSSARLSPSGACTAQGCGG